MTDKEQLSRGDALAKVAALEAELAELCKRVCVPDGYVVVPVDPTNSMTSVGQSLRYDPVNSIGSIYRAMLAAAPAPVERVEQEALRKRFDEIEREICEGKHTAASVFTQMRTAAFYTAPQPTPTAAQDVANQDGGMDD